MFLSIKKTLLYTPEYGKTTVRDIGFWSNLYKADTSL